MSLELAKNFRTIFEKTRQRGSTRLIVGACNGPPHGAVIMANSKCLQQWKDQAGVAKLVSLYDSHAYLNLNSGPVTIDLFAVDCIVAEALRFEGEMKEKFGELENLLSDYRHRLQVIEDRRTKDKTDIAALRDMLANVLRSEFNRAEQYPERHIIHKAKALLEETSRRE